ncbi:regulator of G-protein signaling 7-like isoform X3 [Mercenaria mercenaria]|uniref:regulator of G-protein signaling 7-like isoform X3 n=1 Tax=Mercenaria mercenaria TaxID=6596 RepID=UPI00234F8556|nr:regulator of G-protein signaling 7-like isoform X3 [Mercenaria mercenaria]
MAASHRYNKRTESLPNTLPNALMFGNGQINHEENPNYLVYKKMEGIVDRMQDEATGVPVRTVKSFMSKVPSVFTGQDLIFWMMKNLDVDDQVEALHLAHLMSSHGYFFPIDDHVLTVKCDNTYYRFQTPCFWPSKCGEPENTDYAVYLCKRTMQNKQRLELADYEAENLARLQKMFSRKWEFIFMQAEAQAKVDKKRDKLERKVLDSQERAFWDVHRPVPGCVNTTEVDIKKACRMNRHSKMSRPNYAVPGGRLSPSVSEVDLNHPADSLHKDLLHNIEMLKKKLEKRRVKISKVTESYISYYEQYAEYDAFCTPADPTNPWITDSTEYWDQDKTMNARDIPLRRVKRWAFSIEELLRDTAGKDQFSKFLDKEFSGENLKFWLACQELKSVKVAELHDKVHEIYSEFLAPGAHNPVNIDARIAELVRKRVDDNPNRYCFAEAQDHIFKLMKSDSYGRYVRSDMYKDYLSGTRKKVRLLLPSIASNFTFKHT